MTITPAIRTEAEIDALVFSPSFQGGHVRRNNARKKMAAWSNELVLEKIEALRAEAKRMRRLEGAKEQDLRSLYADITALELRLH